MIDYSIPSYIKITYKEYTDWQISVGLLKPEDVEIRYLIGMWTLLSIRVADEAELLLTKIRFGI